MLSLNLSEMPLPYNLQVVLVGIGSATYDQIEFDIAFTVESALGLVGGTMGLFLGFSVLSAIEIVYYLAKHMTKYFTNKKEHKNTNKKEYKKGKHSTPLAAHLLELGSGEAGVSGESGDPGYSG